MSDKYDDQIMKVAVAVALSEFYPDLDDVEKWMTTPHKLLRDRTAQECIESGDADAVWTVIEQLQTGAFV